MDYQRIYREFIVDRRNKEDAVKGTALCERHHIVPKSIGGDNAENNLIYLTFSDHFFAHLLLAKTRRRPLVYAARLLLARVKGQKGKLARRRYSWLNEKYREAKSLYQTERMKNPDNRKKISDKLKGRKLSADTIAKWIKTRRANGRPWLPLATVVAIARKRTGEKQSVETVEKRRLKLIGKRRTKVQRKATSLAIRHHWLTRDRVPLNEAQLAGLKKGRVVLGQVLSAKHRRALSRGAKRRKPASEATRAKLSAISKGAIRSPELRQRIATSVRASWLKRKRTLSKAQKHRLSLGMKRSWVERRAA